MTELLTPTTATIDITHFLTPQTFLLAGAIGLPLLFLSLISSRNKLPNNVHSMNSPQYDHLRQRVQQRRVS